MTVKQKDRAAVYKRDDHACVLAGVEHRFARCWGPLTIQHTVNRGAGGSKLFDTPDLLITMCNGHNTLATADADFAQFCKERGLVRYRNSKRDPRLVPVLYLDGWHHLEGVERVPVNANDAIEYLILIGVITTGKGWAY